jgi:O-antigen ligase
MKQDRFNYYISNLNVANIIIGYVFCVSLLVPVLGTQTGASQLITIPYRGFSLFLSLLVIILNLKSRVKLTSPVLIFFLFWIVVLIRMFYDLEIRTDFYVLQSYKSKVWLIAIAGCFVPMISLFKSIKIIDFDYCFNLLYKGCIIILIPSILFSLGELEGNTRDTGNIALDPISFGSIGITLSLVCIYKIINTNSKKNKIKLLLNIILCFLGLYLALQSASRGPVLGLLLIVVFLYVVYKRKGLFTFSFFIITIFLFRNFLINSVSFLAPFLAKRLNELISGDDVSILARQESYIWFIEQISKYPFLGSQFARLGNGHYPGYAHSIILDILLGFGIVGLITCIYIIYIAFKNLINSIRIKKHYWVGLIMMQQVLLSLGSGAYYSNPVLNCLIILTLLLPLKDVRYKLKN